MRSTLCALFGVVLAVAGCSSDGDAGADGAGTDATVAPVTTGEVADAAGTDAVATTVADAKAQPARTVDGVDAPAGIEPEDFATVTARIISADGEVCDVCLWVADTVADRGRGLMGVTDLGEPVGMLFRWDERIEGSFFMFGTPMPLSIAWFDAADDGPAVHVGQADMAPCLTDDSGQCPRYDPGAGYRLAVEMVQGELDVVGIATGSTIEVIAEHPTCPAA